MSNYNLFERNSVAYLKTIKFNEKVVIKKKGRPIPNLTISKSGSSRGKGYICKFNNDIYKKHDWVCGCIQTNALYCFPCLLFGGNSAWTKCGISDLVYLQAKIYKHESSSKHMNNVIDLSLLNQVNIATQLNTGYQLYVANHNEKVKKK